MEYRPTLQSDLVRDQTWVGTAAPRGLGRGLLDPVADITAALERSESLLRYSDVITHMLTSHALPPEPNWARTAWRN